MFATESQTKIEDQPPTLAEIVREETDNGREIIRFLLDVMRNRFEDVKMCHRVQAAVQLAKLGSKEAEAFLKAASRSKNGRAPSRAPAQSRQNDELADIIKQETSNGRDIVRFLVDVMHGNLDGFKPCHRIAAAKELLRRGFENTPADYDDDVQQCHDEPFDHKKYAREQFWRDGADGKALAQIYGSEEAVSAALSAVRTHRRRTVLADAHIPDLDYTPIENPEDDPYGKGCFGYDSLRLSFNDNQAVRAANEAVAEYKMQMAERPEEETAREGPPVDRPSCCFPKSTAPSSSEEDDTMPPDHWSRKYMERIRNRSIETDMPPENPDPGQSKTHNLSDAKDPPRKRPVKIFVGPPDEDPRQYRDPGDFQGAIDNIWSAGDF